MRIKLPGHKQKHPYTCLPASIKITLDYLGHEISEEEVEKVCKTTKAGTVPRNAVAGIKALGYNALSFEGGTIDLLELYLSRQLPVIAFLKVSELPYGIGGTHAVVVCGVEEGKVIYFDPGLGVEVKLKRKAFLKAWQSLNRTGLMIWR